jgi:hypothetical protein
MCMYNVCVLDPAVSQTIGQAIDTQPYISMVKLIKSNGVDDAVLSYIHEVMPWIEEAGMQKCLEMSH